MRTSDLLHLKAQDRPCSFDDVVHQRTTFTNTAKHAGKVVPLDAFFKVKKAFQNISSSNRSMELTYFCALSFNFTPL